VVEDLLHARGAAAFEQHCIPRLKRGFQMSGTGFVRRKVLRLSESGSFGGFADQRGFIAYSEDGIKSLGGGVSADITMTFDRVNTQFTHATEHGDLAP
jgi:hypothetical protein